MLKKIGLVSLFIGLLSIGSLWVGGYHLDHTAHMIAQVEARPLAVSYSVTGRDRFIIPSFFFEDFGYAHYQCGSTGTTFRQEYAADRDTDLLQFYRDCIPSTWTFDGGTAPDAEASEAAMHWWIWQNNGVNVPVSSLPVEKTEWVGFLDGFISSIDAGLIAVSQMDRDATSAQDIVVQGNTVVETRPSGSHAVAQRAIYSDVRNLLQTGM